MPPKTETEYAIFAVFLIGAIVAFYYLVSVFAEGINLTAILEKTILVGVIVAILTILAIVLLKEMELKRQMEELKQPAPKAAKKRTVKDVKEELMRLYRDLGALKIILHDNIIDEASYQKEKRALEKKINILKKEQESLTEKQA